MIYTYYIHSVSVQYSVSNKPLSGDVYSMCDKVCQWLVAGRWLTPGTPLFFTNKTVRHDITEILLKVAITRNPLGESWENVYVLCGTVTRNITTMLFEMGIWLWIRDTLIYRMNEWTLNGHFRYVVLRRLFLHSNTMTYWKCSWQKTSRATSRYSFIPTVWWYNILYYVQQIYTT